MTSTILSLSILTIFLNSIDCFRGNGKNYTTTGFFRGAAYQPPLQPTLNNDPSPEYEVSILGSTGSIGTQALEALEDAKGIRFKVSALAAGGSNLQKLLSQIKRYKPDVIAVSNLEKERKMEALLLKENIKNLQIVSVEEVGSYTRDDPKTKKVLVSGIVGIAGLKPTIAGIKARKRIALANKETLISAGSVILELMKKYDTEMIPADSEHSAIFQCLANNTANQTDLKRLILTASGGAFRDWTSKEMEKATLADALAHPNWSMGQKITVDSATLMNKALEVIEAHYLFGVPYDNINVLIHPQSIIHSLIEYNDTSTIAQLGLPDMRLPLLHSIVYPERPVTSFPPLELEKLNKSLSFFEPDVKRFPCLELGFEAGKMGGVYPAVLNAANEIANEKFRNQLIGFSDIPRILRRTLDAHNPPTTPITLETITSVDAWARNFADSLLTS